MFWRARHANWQGYRNANQSNDIFLERKIERKSGWNWQVFVWIAISWCSTAAGECWKWIVLFSIGAWTENKVERKIKQNTSVTLLINVFDRDLCAFLHGRLNVVAICEIGFGFVLLCLMQFKFMCTIPNDSNSKHHLSSASSLSVGLLCYFDVRRFHLTKTIFALKRAFLRMKKCEFEN